MRVDLIPATLVLGLLGSMAASAAEPPCSTAHPERFVSFYPTFADSKAFALQRTNLPLPLLHWTGEVDPDGRPAGAPERQLLSGNDYRQWPSLNRYMQDNELLSRIRDQSPTAAVLDLYREGVAGLVIFHFRVQAGCWRLWQYEVREQ